MLFWGVLLLVTLVAYAALVVNITIGGFTDIRRMIKKLSDTENPNHDS